MKHILFFTLLYGLIVLASEYASDALQLPHLFSSLCLPLYLFAVLAILRKRGNLQNYRTTWVRNHWQALILTAPLLLLPVCNLFSGAPFARTGIPTLVCSCVFSSSAAFAEELLFRGALPTALTARFAMRRPTAVCLSTAAFAILHFANLVSGMDFQSCCLQALFAFSVGYALAALTEATASIFPATIIHILINLSAADSADSRTVLFAAVPTLGYGLWISSRTKKKETR